MRIDVTEEAARAAMRAVNESPRGQRGATPGLDDVRACLEAAIPHLVVHDRGTEVRGAMALGEFLILRRDVQRDGWREVATVRAGDAEAAFRRHVIRPNEIHDGKVLGEYLTVPLDVSVRRAIQLRLLDPATGEDVPA